MKKQKRQKLLSQEQVEKAFQKTVGVFRRIRGFVNIEIRATVRVQHDTDPNKAVVLVSKHAV
jgi:hypothetical protein